MFIIYCDLIYRIYNCDITSQHLQLSHNGIPLVDKKKSLGAYNVKDGDMLLMTFSTPPNNQAPRPSSGSILQRTGIDWSAIQVPG